MGIGRGRLVLSCHLIDFYLAYPLGTTPNELVVSAISVTLSYYKAPDNSQEITPFNFQADTADIPALDDVQHEAENERATTLKKTLILGMKPAKLTLPIKPMSLLYLSCLKQYNLCVNQETGCFECAF